MSEYRTISTKAVDGVVITLPNNVENITFGVTSQGRANIVSVHGIAPVDGRVGETDYQVVAVECWDGNTVDVPEADYVETVHVNGLRFYTVALIEVAE